MRGTATAYVVRQLCVVGLPGSTSHGRCASFVPCANASVPGGVPHTADLPLVFDDPIFSIDGFPGLNATDHQATHRTHHPRAHPCVLASLVSTHVCGMRMRGRTMARGWDELRVASDARGTGVAASCAPRHRAVTRTSTKHRRRFH